MKIKDINILAFGKLKNKKISFSEGLNVIYGQNESGKTTISSFIEAMFYSFPPRSDRAKYMPWDNSPAAGEMTITDKGEDFTIYRKFGSTPKEDILQPKDFSFKELIPPGRESYRKTIYSPEGKAGDFGTTREIEILMANLMASGGENTAVTAAVKNLEKLRRALNSGNKVKTFENKISALEDELSLSSTQEKQVFEKKLQIFEKTNILKDYEIQLKECEKTENRHFSHRLKELDLQLSAQAEYISQFPDTSSSLPKKESFFTKMFLLAILCSIALLITGFLLNLILCFSAILPIAVYLGFYAFKLKKHSLKLKEFLSLRNCSSEEEYESMRSDKEDAVKYYNSLLKEKSDLVTLSSDELKKADSSIIYRKVLSLKQEIESLKDEARSPYRESVLIKEELAHFKALHQELSKKLSAINSAIDAFNYAKEVISKDFTPPVTKKAMTYLGMIAPKKERSVTLSEDMSLTVSDPLRQSIFSQSMGFREEAYLCFRIAWSEYLYGNNFPLILDDPFSYSDDYREKAIINLLYSISETRQVIVFTNRKNDYFNQLNCNWVDITPINDV